MISFFGVSTISGCAMTQEIKSKASKHLEGECLELFTTGFEYGYYLSNSLANSMSGALQPKGVFALAKDPNGRYACAIKNNRRGTDSGASWEELEREALVRCEVNRRQFNVNAPCVVFARGLNIVYESDSKTKRAF